MIDKSPIKTEKRAKLLLSIKNIPPDKMDIVNSLLFNISLSKQEKYSAIIDIIKFCPDKKAGKRKNNKPEPPKIPEIKKISVGSVGSDGSAQFINQLYLKYKPLKLFKKRYLIHANNKFGFGFRKRLIPGRKLIKILWDIFSFQEKTMLRLPEILISILKDDNIDDATQFNYLRIFRRWMMETPIIKYDMFEIKWMSISHIESELHSYVVNYFSFLKMDAESREQILLTTENKLRLMDDLQKEEISQDDSDGRKNEKEKMNFKKEKIIFDYMMTMRSFIQPNSDNRTNLISDHLKSKYNIDSLTDLLLIMLEALVFQKDTNINDIISRYEIKAHMVNPEVWDYNDEFLKEIGKDPESRRKKIIRKLKDELIPYDELFSFLKLRIDGQPVLQSAVEVQWKIADKRQKDITNIYNDDFLSFIDLCVNYFNNTYTPLLNGSLLTFLTKEGASYEGSMFSPALFNNELSIISDLVGELNEFKSSNPHLTVTRKEAIKILQGKIRPSKFEIQRFITLIGDAFYQIGDMLHTIYEKHRLWIMSNNNECTKIFTNPIKKIPDEKSPIPFFNCRIAEIKDKRLLTDRQINNPVLTDSARSGIIITINAFSYQLAYECLNDNIYSRLERRKEITKKINEIGG